MKFKKIDLGQILTIAANLGVIAGILLLAFELSQTRELTKAQIRNDLSTGLTNYFSVVVNPEYMEVLTRAINDEPVSESEIAMLEAGYSMHFRVLENVHYQYRQGLLDESEFDGQRNFWRNLFVNKPRADYWCQVRFGYSPDFVKEIEDSVLTIHQCE